MKFPQKLLFLIFLFFSYSVKAQFKINTLSDVNIISKKIPKKPFFSTFSSKSLFNNRTFGNARYNFNDSKKEFRSLIAIRVENNTRHRIKLDSLLIKTTPIDSSNLMIFFDVFQENKRWSTSKVRIANRGKRIIAMFFEKDTYLPIGISYIGFTVYSKTDGDFRFYVNSKIIGYLYSYNKQKDLFELLNTDDMPSIPVPQIKLFYTRLE